MKNQRISIADDDHRVVQFRPRPGGNPSPPPSEGVRPSATILPIRHDLAQYEREHDEAADDFRHRMLTNLAALGFTVALTVAGIWLATSIAELRRNQDCALVGRRDCTPIAAPSG